MPGRPSARSRRQKLLPLPPKAKRRKSKLENRNSGNSRASVGLGGYIHGRAGMCRAYGATHYDVLRTQRSRTGLTCGAPPALGEEGRSPALRESNVRLSLTRTEGKNSIKLRFRRLGRDSRFVVRMQFLLEAKHRIERLEGRTNPVPFYSLARGPTSCPTYRFAHPRRQRFQAPPLRPASHSARWNIDFHKKEIYHV